MNLVYQIFYQSAIDLFYFIELNSMTLKKGAKNIFFAPKQPNNYKEQPYILGHIVEIIFNLNPNSLVSDLIVRINNLNNNICILTID